jgi:hypothetical protein
LLNAIRTLGGFLSGAAKIDANRIRLKIWNKVHDPRRRNRCSVKAAGRQACLPSLQACFPVSCGYDGISVCVDFWTLETFLDDHGPREASRRGRKGGPGGPVWTAEIKARLRWRFPGRESVRTRVIQKRARPVLSRESLPSTISIQTRAAV